MGELWVTLGPLVVGSAVVPIQLVITILLLNSRAGKRTAVAWVAGLTMLRVAQGVVLGLLFSASDVDDDGGHALLGPSLLLVFSILFYVVAGRELLAHSDEDAPPPKWLARVETATPAQGFALGVIVLAVGVKFWVFTVGVVSAIADAGLGPAASILNYLAFIALAESLHLVIFGIAFAAPALADRALGRFASVLKTRNREITITLGAIFGTWFLVKALSGFGML